MVKETVSSENAKFQGGFFVNRKPRANSTSSPFAEESLREEKNSKTRGQSTARNTTTAKYSSRRRNILENYKAVPSSFDELADSIEGSFRTRTFAFSRITATVDKNDVQSPWGAAECSFHRREKRRALDGSTGVVDILHRRSMNVTFSRVGRTLTANRRGSTIHCSPALLPTLCRGTTYKRPATECYTHAGCTGLPRKNIIDRENRDRVTDLRGEFTRSFLLAADQS